MELESLYELCGYSNSRVVGVTSTPNWRRAAPAAAAASDESDDESTLAHRAMEDSDAEHVIVTFETLGVHVYRVCASRFGQPADSALTRVTSGGRALQLADRKCVASWTQPTLTAAALASSASSAAAAAASATSACVFTSAAQRHPATGRLAAIENRRRVRSWDAIPPPAATNATASTASRLWTDASALRDLCASTVTATAAAPEAKLFGGRKSKSAAASAATAKPVDAAAFSASAVHALHACAAFSDWIVVRADGRVQLLSDDLQALSALSPATAATSSVVCSELQALQPSVGGALLTVVRGTASNVYAVDFYHFRAPKSTQLSAAAIATAHAELSPLAIGIAVPVSNACALVSCSFQHVSRSLSCFDSNGVWHMIKLNRSPLNAVSAEATATVEPLSFAPVFTRALTGFSVPSVTSLFVSPYFVALGGYRTSAAASTSSGWTLTVWETLYGTLQLTQSLVAPPPVSSPITPPPATTPASKKSKKNPAAGAANSASDVLPPSAHSPLLLSLSPPLSTAVTASPDGSSNLFVALPASISVCQLSLPVPGTAAAATVATTAPTATAGAIVLPSLAHALGGLARGAAGSALTLPLLSTAQQSALTRPPLSSLINPMAQFVAAPATSTAADSKTDSAASTVPASASKPKRKRSDPVPTASTVADALDGADESLLARWSAPTALQAADAREQSVLDTLLQLQVHAASYDDAKAGAAAAAAAAAVTGSATAPSESAEKLAAAARVKFQSAFDAYVAIRRKEREASIAAAAAALNLQSTTSTAGAPAKAKPPALLLSHNFLVRAANRAVDVAIQHLNYHVGSKTDSKSNGSAAAAAAAGAHTPMSLTCNCPLLWSVLKVLIDCNALSARASPNLIPTLLVYKKLDLLESCLTHIHDLAESDLVLILSFVLTTLPVSAAKVAPTPSANPSLPVVSSSVWTGDSDYHRQLKTLLYLVMSSPRSDAFLRRALKALTVPHVTALLASISEWMYKYSSTADSDLKIMHAPAPRIPTFAQVVDWAMMVLDSHFSSLLLLGDPATLTQLATLTRLSAAHLAFCERADSLRGVLTQFVQQSTGKATNPQPPLLDYSVEALYL